MQDHDEPGVLNDAIVAGARRGEATAWRVVFDDLAPAIAAYFRSRRMVDADDLTGEVFLEVARRMASFDGDARGFRAWVFTIAHSRYVDAVRSLERRPTAPLEVADEPAAPLDVAEEATTAVLRTRLLAAADTLTPDQRSVLLLRIFGDLSVAETAEAVGKSPVAVRVHLHRAIRALERELAPHSSMAAEVAGAVEAGALGVTRGLSPSVAPREVGRS